MAKKKTKSAKAKTKKAERAYNHLCHYCLQPWEPGKSHDCNPISERDLFEPFDEDVRDAFEKIKSMAQEFGDQRIYNNARAVMFSRRVCYMFVRPKKKYLELTFFLGRKEESLGIKVQESTKTKFSHVMRIIHADQIEEPLTDWLREAYEFSV